MEYEFSVDTRGSSFIKGQVHWIPKAAWGRGKEEEISLKRKVGKSRFSGASVIIAHFAILPKTRKGDWVGSAAPAESQARRRLALTCQTRLEGVLKFSGGLKVDEVVLPGWDPSGQIPKPTLQTVPTEF